VEQSQFTHPPTPPTPSPPNWNEVTTLGVELGETP
jgi:hypothetical protein